MIRRKRRLSQQDLRVMGASPRRLAMRYTPDGERAQVRQLTAETRPQPPLDRGSLVEVKSTRRVKEKALSLLRSVRRSSPGRGGGNTYWLNAPA